MEQQTPTTTDQKMDKILEHLENLDRRDRLRTWGGFVRTILGLIPIIILLWSTWYAVTHADELLERVAKEAAKQAATVTTESANSMQERLRELFPQGN